MITLKVTFEVRLYEGRLEPPYVQESNWDLWFYDNFINTALNHEDLRPGEYIKVLECEPVTQLPNTNIPAAYRKKWAAGTFSLDRETLIKSV